MSKSRFTITITCDSDHQSKVSSELLKDLCMLISQYGLKLVTISLDEDIKWLEQSAVEVKKDSKTHECKILRFPTDRCKDPNDSNSI